MQSQITSNFLIMDRAFSEVKNVLNMSISQLGFMLSILERADSILDLPSLERSFLIFLCPSLISVPGRIMLVIPQPPSGSSPSLLRRIIEAPRILSAGP